MTQNIHEHIHPAVVPVNTEGKPVDIEKSITTASEEEAVYTYHSAKIRLLSAGEWAQLPGFTGAGFSLVKSNVATNSALMELNDYIKIALPAPGPSNGDGFDWMKVESMLDNFDADSSESFGVTLRASANPYNKSTDVAAHYFKHNATATFIVKRKDKTVTASYHGRNEVANLKDNHLKDQIRNAVVAFGAMAGLSELQWRILLNGLLSPEPTQ